MIKGIGHIRNMNISTHAGIIVILTLGLLISWFTVNTGEKIVNNTPQSKIYASQKDAQKMIDQNMK